MTIQDYFNKFEENIKLTPNQREDARTKYNSVCEKLHNYYYPNEKYDGRKKLLVGSYGKHTNIRPARDIDVIFIIPDSLKNDFLYCQSNGASKLLQQVRLILMDKFSHTNISTSEKIVAVKFSESNHNVEVIPAFYLNNKDAFLIPNSANGGIWETVFYKQEIEKLNILNDKTDGNFRKLTRFIKKWTETIYVDIKTYEIEKYVVSFLENYYRGSYINSSNLIRDFFHYFSNNGYFNDEKIKSAIRTAYERARKACNFEENNEIEEALDEWVKIFGRDFPKYLSNSNNSNDSPEEIKDPYNPYNSWVSKN